MEPALGYTMLQPPIRLPTADELPDSDDPPVAHELQDLILGLLKLLLARIWAERQDWFFAVAMALYFDPDDAPIVPDGMLALGVPQCSLEYSGSRIKKYPGALGNVNAWGEHSHYDRGAIRCCKLTSETRNPLALAVGSVNPEERAEQETQARLLAEQYTQRETQARILAEERCQRAEQILAALHQRLRDWASILIASPSHP